MGQEKIMFRKMTAEVLGTFILVLFGCGAAVIAGGNGMSGIGLTGIPSPSALPSWLRPMA